MSRLPITVMIPTINAEGHLVELIESIRDVAEEIFIVDSLSLDRTVDLALELGVKIVQRPFVTSSDQCGWMMSHLPVKTPWIFFMAQDERFSESLKRELARVLTTDPPDDGFTVKWRLWFMGQPLHAQTDNLRLLRTGKCGVTQVSCNEHFLVDGSVAKLTGVLEHRDSLTLYDWYEKQNIWSTREAVGRLRDTSLQEQPRLLGTALQRKMFLKRLANRMPGGDLILFWYYFLTFGAWMDGMAGWRWASLRVWTHRVVRLKVEEMRITKRIPRLPEARHGDYDSRVMKSDLQRALLPDLVEAWRQRRT